MTTTATKRRLLAVLAGALCLPVLGLRADPAAKREQFVYVLRVTPGFHDERHWTEKENAAIGRHFDRLARASRSGQVILAGRTTEALADTFGIVIFEAEHGEAARQFMEADPAVVAGLMSASLHPYTVALQRKPVAK